MGLRGFVRRLSGEREGGPADRPSPLRSPNVPAPEAGRHDPYDLDEADAEPADYDDGVSGHAAADEEEAGGAGSDAG